ncbi:MAG: TIGR04283 family arsenosugar biosynthesis glycosyltransferase [Betaproteobacteria bacterium]|nr:TIGR04283 family arsenosugar biosynthesis glycosyltransferase [Betaproteobacteria bacterium]
MWLSIIVPVLDEAGGLPAFVAALRERVEADMELIFVDGGSTDGSAERLREAGCTVLASERGRACQMNAGAARARGEVLLFLHADTTLPEGFADAIARGLASGKCWGRFDVVLVGRPVLLKLVATMMNLRSRLTGIATGDQALFLSRGTFDAVGGFPAQPLMEDIEISRRLKRLTAPACLHARVMTSARRWEAHGLWRTIFLMWRLRWSYWRGVPAAELARRYG